jgi:hypothetical protein
VCIPSSASPALHPSAASPPHSNGHCSPHCSTAGHPLPSRTSALSSVPFWTSAVPSFSGAWNPSARHPLAQTASPFAIHLERRSSHSHRLITSPPPLPQSTSRDHAAVHPPTSSAPAQKRRARYPTLRSRRPQVCRISRRVRSPWRLHEKHSI